MHEKGNTQSAHLEGMFFKLVRRDDAHEIIGGACDRRAGHVRRRWRVVCVKPVDGRRRVLAVDRSDGGRLIPSEIGVVSEFLCSDRWR